MKKICLLLICLMITSCATNQAYLSSSSLSVPSAPSVLLLPIEASVFENQALSESEPLAIESESLYENLEKGLIDFMFDNGIEPIPYGQKIIKDEHLSILNEAAIMVDAVDSYNNKKQSRFYGLSKDSIEQLNSYSASYVLLVEYDERIPSGGKMALDMLMVMAGYNARPYDQSFRFAMFDLRNGELVWAFTQRFGQGDGSSGTVAQPLHNAKPKKLARNINIIMKEFPLQ